MNRRQKIIVSVTGIFLVLLILVGLTYAYFLTQIQGNENDKSITVTTANLRLVYTDGNGVLTPAEMLLPGNTVKFKDKDNNIVESKTFAVTNEGNEKTDYVVIIEDVKVTNATTNVTTTFESNDFRYTITCTNGTTECNGVKTEVFPMNGGIVVGNNINVGETQTYTLTMEYLETNKDQSNDMNKTLSAKINIKDIRSINPYSDDKDSLAYNIINNSMLAKNGTKLVATPPSKVALDKSLTYWEDGIRDYTYVEIEDYIGYDYYDEETGDYKGVITSNTTCSELDGTYSEYYDEEAGEYLVESYECINGKLSIGFTSPERILSATSDDYGESYYYRGNTKDNYVNFAGMCWKIVRIQGDGSIKLILEDQYTTCDDNETTNSEEVYTGNWNIGNGNYGVYKPDFGSSIYYLINYLKPSYTESTPMVKAFYDFQTNKLSDYTSKLKSGDWCIANKAYLNSGTFPNYIFNLITEDEELSYKKASKGIYYDSYVRLYNSYLSSNKYYNPTLKCTGYKMTNFENHTVNDIEITKEVNMYVGTLTADEVVYAGANEQMNNHYLYSVIENADYWWTLSPSENTDVTGDRAFSVSTSGGLYPGLMARLSCEANTTSGCYSFNVFRPSIILNDNIEITKGDGTQNNPYVVE